MKKANCGDILVTMGSIWQYFEGNFALAPKFLPNPLQFHCKRHHERTTVVVQIWPSGSDFSQLIERNMPLAAPETSHCFLEQKHFQWKQYAGNIIFQSISRISYKHKKDTQELEVFCVESMRVPRNRVHVYWF